MRSIHGSLALAATLVLAISTNTAGCFFFDPASDCELNLNLKCASGGTSGTTGGSDGGTSPECMPSVGKAPGNECGVFVSSSGGDDGNEGTREKPLETLDAAVAMATSRSKPVYACAEEFQGSVTLASGIEIYGGLDCANAWAYVGIMKRSVLLGHADEIALTITKNAGNVKVYDFMIQATNATMEGGSSIAVLVEGATAEIIRCGLAAGDGAPGAVGAPGDPNGMSAASGMAGNSGKDACSAAPPDAKLPGGDAVANDCGGGDVSVGGSGGNGNVLFGEGGSDGQTGSAGQGGTGEPAAGMWSCLGGAGEIGSPGEGGAAGMGAVGPGSLSPSGYMGTSGSAGTPGKAGQGGGGGGGAKGGMICGGGAAGSGASGGSGGAGGCGGLPGQGGGPGGASIAFVSLSASVTLRDCTLTTGRGGDGGAGGNLQPGGSGGLPGIGGKGTGGSKNACSGGEGGQGGNGGPGGGGFGGPAIGIAYTGNPPERAGEVVVTFGMPGGGGLGGGASMANQGETGLAAEEQKFD